MNAGSAEYRPNVPRAVLQRSEEQAKLFIEAVQDYAIFMLDRNGYVISWNVGAERIKGYKAQEILGQHFSVFYPEDEAKAGKPAKDLEIAAREGRHENEGWRIRKDGSRFFASLIITAVRGPDGRLIGFGKVTRDITERMLAQKALEESERKLHESERALRQLSVHLLRTQDQERRRIGRELHDSLGQYLSALKMKLDSMEFLQEGSANAMPKEIGECSELAETCIKEVRTISYLLYPPFLEEQGLGAAIRWYLDGFQQRSGIHVQYRAPEEFERISRDTELVLFRVLQESLTNVHRHSGSATADIILARTDESVTMEIADQGKGLPREVIQDASSGWMGARGVGLRGMSERVRQVGGKLEISSDASGTKLRVTVPVQPYPGSEDDS
jgi:PAS domain S-box-containing protein